MALCDSKFSENSYLQTQLIDHLVEIHNGNKILRKKTVRISVIPTHLCNTCSPGCGIRRNASEIALTSRGPRSSNPKPHSTGSPKCPQIENYSHTMVKIVIKAESLVNNIRSKQY